MTLCYRKVAIGLLAILTASSCAGTSSAAPSAATKIFVSAVDGDDSNSGTVERPLRTATEALSRAQAGTMTTIVLRAGDYRESLGGISKPVTLEAYSGEEVWLKGSSVIEPHRFVQDGHAWRLDGWNPDICRPGADLKACVYPSDITQGNELAGDPAMVFLNGKPMRQVADREHLRVGTFYSDSARNALYVGSDPAGQSIEVSDRRYAVQFLPGSEHSVVRGLGFTHYATSQDYRKQPAAVIAQADGVILEDNTITLNAAAGIVANASGMRLSGNEISYNGSNGVLSYQAGDLTFDGNRVIGNNLERTGLESARSLAGAGVKATYLRNAIIRDNVFDGNLGAGFWCDLSCENVTMVRNLARNNSKHGLYYEVSSRGLIASNLMTGNGQYGLKISGSNQVRVYNNTLADNAQTLLIAEDPRPHADRCSSDNCPGKEALDRGVTWDTTDVTLVNNIFAARAGGETVVETIDANERSSGKRVGADGMIPVSQMDHNGYYRADAASPSQLVTWALQDGGDAGYPTLPAFAETGRERHGLYQEGAQTYFIGKDGYRVRPDSAAATGGLPLPEDVAAAVGVEAGARPPLGALRWPGSNGEETRPEATPEPTDPSSGRRTSSGTGVLDRTVLLLSHPDDGRVLMTLDRKEAEQAATFQGFEDLGVGFLASHRRGPALAPVYRLAHPTTGDLLFTTSATERESAVAQWGYHARAVAFYAAAAPGPGLVAVHRLQKRAYHHYTTDTSARDAAIADGWRYEDIAFYVRPAA
ncbi:right-handed parallel beta-helix repeat-containing protein [Nonomuraea mangrovi]|uniref:Right-handed parallel beta-helix repeat-containing protein n=1 Tax=Nonomuraea mangrovi TaxID=2316207 RepID=A0ABW4T695_9ACTN